MRAIIFFFLCVSSLQATVPQEVRDYVAAEKQSKLSDWDQKAQEACEVRQKAREKIIMELAEHEVKEAAKSSGDLLRLAALKIQEWFVTAEK